MSYSPLQNRTMFPNRFKLGSSRNSEWKCFYCLHVRTATILLGIWHLVSEIWAKIALYWIFFVWCRYCMCSRWPFWHCWCVITMWLCKVRNSDKATFYQHLWAKSRMKIIPIIYQLHRMAVRSTQVSFVVFLLWKSYHGCVYKEQSCVKSCFVFETWSRNKVQVVKKLNLENEFMRD